MKEINKTEFLFSLDELFKWVPQLEEYIDENLREVLNKEVWWDIEIYQSSDGIEYLKVKVDDQHE